MEAGPCEFFALTWGDLTATYVDVRQRIYRGIIDTPKTSLSIRQAVLPEGLLQEIEAWRAVSLERTMTPGSFHLRS